MDEFQELCFCRLRSQGNGKTSSAMESICKFTSSKRGVLSNTRLNSGFRHQAARRIDSMSNPTIPEVRFSETALLLLVQAEAAAVEERQRHRSLMVALHSRLFNLPQDMVLA